VTVLVVLAAAAVVLLVLECWDALRKD